MTDAHKPSLAKGREQARAVRGYLEWLDWSKPTRGRKRDTSPERLAEVETRIAEASSPLQRLQLVQLLLTGNADRMLPVQRVTRSAEGLGLRELRVEVLNGGHMLLHEQPNAVLDLLSRWLRAVQNSTPA